MSDGCTGSPQISLADFDSLDGIFVAFGISKASFYQGNRHHCARLVGVSQRFETSGEQLNG